MTAESRRWSRKPRRLTTPAVLGVVAMVAAACGGSGGGSGSSASGTSGGTPLSATQTITMSIQGLGDEGNATKAAVADFEKAHPNIKVTFDVLSPTADNARQQLQQGFIAGSSTPDVITGDVIWPPAFAKAGWVAPLDAYHPDTSAFFPGQMATGQYSGKTYAIPWFINAEGIYYRKDLVPTPPSTPEQLVADAKAAMAKDPALKYGLAFEGAKYEGAITAWINFLGGFGGKLDPSKIDTPANAQALQFMHDTIYKDQIAPQAVTGWQEPNVESAYMSGQAVFAMNWPYVFAEAEKAGSPVQGKTGWIPFPSKTGTPAAALGGDDLMVNAKSTHKAAAWALIQFLTSPAQQIKRAIATGDPPSVQAAYTQQLFAAAPYFQQEEAVYKVATPRPVTPSWPQMSDILSTMLSSVLSNQLAAQEGLTQAAGQLKGVGGS